MCVNKWGCDRCWINLLQSSHNLTLSDALFILIAEILHYVKWIRVVLLGPPTVAVLRWYFGCSHHFGWWLVSVPFSFLKIYTHDSSFIHKATSSLTLYITRLPSCVTWGTPCVQVQAFLDWLGQSCSLGVLYDTRLFKLPLVSIQSYTPSELSANLILLCSGWRLAVSCYRHAHDTNLETITTYSSDINNVLTVDSKVDINNNTGMENKGRSGLTNLRCWLNISQTKYL